MKRSSNAGFTLLELTIASAVSAGVAIALGSFS
jgi:prepilin-type N-terminal cleavage/methylation domain-containing protein